MQLAQIVHSIVAVLFVAAMLAHIYIGTIGMEGAFEAMGTGEVDVNWAQRASQAVAARRKWARPGPATAPAAAGDARRITSAVTLYDPKRPAVSRRALCYIEAHAHHRPRRLERLRQDNFARPR